MTWVVVVKNIPVRDTVYHEVIDSLLISDISVQLNVEEVNHFGIYVQNWNYEAAKEIVNDVLADQTGDV